METVPMQEVEGICPLEGGELPTIIGTLTRIPHNFVTVLLHSPTHLVIV
jgi:hypothetical protein